MIQLNEYSSLTSVLEKLIARENESIAQYEQTAHSLGDTIVTPLLHQLIVGKQHHRLLLEQALEDVKEQFELDEAII